MATVFVNNIPVEIGTEKLNAIQAAKKAGVFIPHYCWHEALTVVASCRMCLIEVGDRKPDGSIAMQPKVVPGCQTPVKDGSVVVTGEFEKSPTAASPPQPMNYGTGYKPGERTRFAQSQTLEDILLNHPLDCPVCDKAGECLLQDYTYGYGKAQSRMIDEKNTPPNKPYIGDNVTLFTDRCIMCSRCVRFTREVSGTAELQIINRGHHSEIDIFPGEPLNNKLASNVVDLCPVGALCSKDFLYTHRVWNLKTVDSVCPDCSTGCSIDLDGNKNIVYRLRPRENPQAQGHFMCDDGRLGYHYINSKERILHPTIREGEKRSPISWAEVVPAIRNEFKAAAQKDATSVVAVLSPFMTCEEAFLAAKYFKSLAPKVRLALGPVPVVGEDDTYPKDRRGKPIQPVKFTIRAEKCPNRRGVEAILRQFQGDVIPFETIVGDAGRGKVSALYLSAAYPPRSFGWLTAAQATELKKVALLVTQELLPSELTKVAKYSLPAASFAEKDGVFVNHSGLAQALHWGVTPTAECRSDGQFLLDLLERRGLIHAASIRKELAAEVPYFAPLASGDLGEFGIPLEAAKQPVHG